MNSIVLVGGGGHCASVIDVIEAEGKYQIVGIVDRSEKVGTKILGYEVLWTDDDLEFLVKKYSNFMITLGQIKSAAPRKSLYFKLKELGANFPVIVSPLAHIARTAKIGEGSIVTHGAIVNSMAKIGVNCIINTKALCEHDVLIGDHCHISTAAVINGNCSVGDEVFVGSNSVIKQGTSISSGEVIPFGVKHG